MARANVAATKKVRSRQLVPVVRYAPLYLYASDKYRGKYPNKVRSASGYYDGDWWLITLMDWSQVRVRKADWAKIAQPIKLEPGTPWARERERDVPEKDVDLFEQLRPDTYKMIDLEGEEAETFRGFFDLMRSIESRARVELPDED